MTPPSTVRRARGGRGRRRGPLERLERVADRRGVRAQAPEQRAEHARAGLGVGQRAVRRVDLDAQRVGQRGEPALAHERRVAARQRDRAQRRRVGPRQPRALERLAQDAAVERRVVGDEHALRRRADELGEVGQDRVGGRRLVDHRLRDLREALDRARQRRGAADERLPAIVQLAAADEHRADLGQLAGVARAAVGLGVDDDELRRRQRLGEQVHRGRFARAKDVMHVRLHHSPTGTGGSLSPMHAQADGAPR